MRFKKFRYNLITIGLVAIVGCAVALPLFTAQNSESGFGETDITEEVIQNIDIEEEIREDEEEVEENDEFLSFKALDWLEYSLDLLYNGNGYESTFTQTIINNTSVASTKLSIPQYSKGTIKRSGKNSLEEGFYWSTWDSVGADELKNSYQYFYIDRENDKMYRGETKTFDRSKMTYDMSKGKVEEYTYEEGINKYLVMVGDDFQIKTTKSEIYSYTQANGLVEIKAVYKLENVPDSYKKFYGITGQLNNINYKNLTVTYVIDAKTGKMKSITRSETMTGSSKGFDATTVVSTKQVFKKVNVDVNLIQPK